jgi:hypothetical protein
MVERQHSGSVWRPSPPPIKGLRMAHPRANLTIEKTHPTGNRSRPADRETLDPPQGKGQEKDVERKSAL